MIKRRVGPIASELGLSSCHACGLVSEKDRRTGAERCPRCKSRLHDRVPNSVGHCWALIIAAYIIYIPANLLPIMETGSFMDYRKDTIMSGVIHLWKTGSWGIASIVFVASIMVPLFKLMALTLLLISVQRRTTWWPMQRARLYRLVELVGRWSMLDIYVVTLLAALVQIRSLATVRAGNGAIAFGAVVVLTMFASMKFDSRLIWDPLRKESDHDYYVTTD
jgi:paraquat-inducible protein A